MLASIFVVCSSLIARTEPPPRHKLLVSVADDNGVAVQSARVTLTHLESHTVIKGETDFAGRREFSGLSAGPYRVLVEKEGFYAAEDFR